MKVKRASYKDDDILIPGVLIERLFRRPVFYSADARCGWQSQEIYKQHKDKVVVWEGTPQVGKSYFCDPDDKNAKSAQRAINYVESFPPTEKRARWMFDGTDPNNVFLTETWCPICGELAMYPEDDDRPLETPFCPHCGTPMDDTVPWDPSWPFYDLPKKRKTPL